MPQVPVANEGQIVKQNAAPNVRVATDAPAEAFGGGSSLAQVSQTATGLGQQAMQIAHEEKQKADDVATTEAYSKTVALRNQLMYDPKNGAMTRKGKDAFGVSDEYGKKFKDATDEINSSLTNDDQRTMYNKIRANEGRDLESSLTKHTYQEAQNYDQETTKASVQTSQQDAIMNYQNPGKIQESLAMQKNLIAANGTRMGLPPEEVQHQQMDAESKTHAGVIERMLANSQDLAASAYYKEVKGNVLGTDAIQLEKALEEGTVRGQSQRGAADIYNKNHDLSSALAQVDKIADPRVQDATRERVKQRFQEKEEAVKLNSDHAFRAAYSAVEKSKNKDDIPPATWAALSPEHKNTITAFLKKDDIITDWPEYYNLKTMASTPELQKKFLSTDLLQYRNKLADADFKNIVDLQDTVRKGGDKSDKLLNGYRTNREIVEGALKPMGIAKDDPRVDDIHRAVDQRIIQEKAVTGKTEIPTSEVQRITDDTIVKAHEAGSSGVFGFFRGDKPAFEFGPDAHLEVDVADIPKSEVKKMTAALKARGIPVTDEKLQQLYSSRLNKVRRGQ